MNNFNLEYAKKLEYDCDFDELFRYCIMHKNVLEAANMLSNCYSRGLGTPCDIKKSHELDMQLIPQGCLDAVSRVAFNHLFEPAYYDTKKGLCMLKEAVSQGCGRAYRYLAFCYEEGIEVSQDYNNAALLYEKAISKGDYDSLSHLGLLYEEGKGVNKDIQNAIKLYMKAVEHHSGIGCLYLAYTYESGNGVEESSQRAIELLELGRKYGNASSIIRLAKYYEKGWNEIDVDLKKAFALYSEAALKCSKQALKQLGRCYLLGIGVERNTETAILYFDKSIERIPTSKKIAEWCASIGKMLDECKEYGLSFEYNSVAAKYGNINGIIIIAQYYEFGYGVDTNFNKAIELYKKAIDLGSTEASACLGLLYYDNKTFFENAEALSIKYLKQALELNEGYLSKEIDEGVLTEDSVITIIQALISCYKQIDDKDELNKCYQQLYDIYINRLDEAEAADQGNINGIINIAKDYEFGDVVDIDYDKAIELYKKASDLGSAEATACLGLLYDDNRSFLEDAEELSIKYLKKALKLNENNLSNGIEDVFTEESISIIIQALISCCKQIDDKDELNKCYQLIYDINIKRLDEGNGDAEYQLGLLFKNKSFESYNLEKAFEYFEQGTLKGNTEAAFQLSACYERGRGTSINLEKAFSIVAAFQDEYENVKCYVGLLYQYGIGVKKSTHTAVKIFESLLDSEDEVVRTDASICLGLCYYHGEGVKSDLEKAKKLLSQAEPFYNMYINNSIRYSALSLVYRCYFEPGKGFGCYFKPDLKKSYYFLIKGYTETHESNYSYQIGTVYLTGSSSRGVKRNLKTAYKFFSESQSEASLEELAIIDYCGKVRKTNEHLVVKNLTENANKGSSKANIYLGLCYYHGYSLKQNYEKAIECFNTASQCNDRLSWFGLAFSALLKICNTEDFVFSLDLAMADLKVAANNDNGIKSLCSLIIDNDYLKLEAFPQLASLEISFLELYLNKNYSKHRFLTLLKGSLSTLFRTIVLVLRYRKKESDVDLSNILSLFREQMKLQKDELERLTDEIQQRDQIIGNQHEIINTLRELDKKIDNITDITISIESSVQEVYSFITGELMQKIACSKNELQQRLEGCTKNIIETNSMKESKGDTSSEIKKMLEEEHEKLISDFISSMSTYINDSIKDSNALFEDERKYLQTMFESGWSKLQSASQTSLVSAGVLWKSCSDISKVDFDFSGVCISATSALESELKKWFFIGFQNYMLSQYGAPDASNWQQTFRDWPDQLLDISKKDYESKLRYNTNHGISDPVDIDLKTDFYLGSLPYLFGVRSGVTRKSLLITRLNEYLKTIIINNPDNARDLFLNPNHNIGMSLIDCCEVIRIQFRNPSAHVEVVDRTKAEECYHKVIGKIASYHYTHNVTGLLIEIMNMIQE